MCGKMVSFAPMNVVLKGKAEDIHAALAMDGMPSYKLKNKISNKKSIALAKVVFDIFDPHYMQLEQIPFASMPGIKFLMLGDGGTEYSTDGTYAIFKDFGGSVMYERFTACSIHQEEIVDTLLDDISKSFLTSDWSYTYLDFSCGEENKFAWKNPWKTDWDDDSNFNSDGLYPKSAAIAPEPIAIETFVCPICWNEKPNHLSSELSYLGQNKDIPETLPICHTCRSELEKYKRMAGWENLRITNAEIVEPNPYHVDEPTPDYCVRAISNIVSGSVAEYDGGELHRIDDIPPGFLPYDA